MVPAPTEAAPQSKPLESLTSMVSTSGVAAAGLRTGCDRKTMAGAASVLAAAVSFGGLGTTAAVIEPSTENRPPVVPLADEASTPTSATVAMKATEMGS